MRTPFIIGVWEPEERIGSRWLSDDFEKALVAAGFPPPKGANLTVLDLHAIEPPL